MPTNYTNLYYDPVREGYSTTTWRTLWGLPIISGNDLSLSDSSMIHSGDILRGDATFSLNISVPTVGDDKRFGFRQHNKNSYAYFDISDNVLSAKTSNGSTTNSKVISWNGDWTDANTKFRIKWEAGTTTFLVGGNILAAITDASISGEPMSLYAENLSSSSMLLNSINVISIQSYRVALMGDSDLSNFNIQVGDSIIASEDTTVTVV